MNGRERTEREPRPGFELANTVIGAPCVLEAAAALAVELGATSAVHQPQRHVRVMIDPAGHPFCLFPLGDR